MGMIVSQRNPMNPLCNFSHDCINKGNYDREHNMVTCFHCVKNGAGGRFVITDRHQPRHFVIPEYKMDFYLSFDLPGKP